jgi:hypothetical protein
MLFPWIVTHAPVPRPPNIMLGASEQQSFVSFWVSCGSPFQESQGAAIAAPDCAVARKSGEAQIFGGTHMNPGWNQPIVVRQSGP